MQYAASDVAQHEGGKDLVCSCGATSEAAYCISTPVILSAAKDLTSATCPIQLLSDPSLRSGRQLQFDGSTFTPVRSVISL